MVIKFAKSSVNNYTNTCSVHLFGHHAFPAAHFTLLITKPNSAAFGTFFAFQHQTFGFTCVSCLSFVACARRDFSWFDKNKTARYWLFLPLDLMFMTAEVRLAAARELCYVLKPQTSAGTVTPQRNRKESGMGGYFQTGRVKGQTLPREWWACGQQNRGEDKKNGNKWLL